MKFWEKYHEQIFNVSTWGTLCLIAFYGLITAETDITIPTTGSYVAELQSNGSWVVDLKYGNTDVIWRTINVWSLGSLDDESEMTGSYRLHGSRIAGDIRREVSLFNDAGTVALKRITIPALYTIRRAEEAKNKTPYQRRHEGEWIGFHRSL